MQKARPQIKANVKWFSDKPKRCRRRRPSPMQLIGLRMADLAKLFRGRYGHVLPDDDAGRDDLFVALNHLACLAHPRGHIERWIEVWTPWLTVAEQRQIVPPILANPMRWKADALAWRLHLNAQDRAALGITTIGAWDEGKAARVKRRKRLDRERKAKLRRKQGIKPRKTYEGQSAEQAAPWVTEGISRRTWYRRRASEVGTDGTSPSAA